MPTERYKFPKIFHLEWSESLQNDDRMLPNTKGLEDGRVIVTEKLDGEGFTLAHDYLHARSLDSKDHLSRHWVKSMHAQKRRDIPDGWRICGENMFALHSIYYTELPSYFLVFAIFNENNDCLSWDDTVEWCEILGLDHVPVLYDGIWDEEKIKECYTGKSNYRAWQPKDFYSICQVWGDDPALKDPEYDQGLDMWDFSSFRDFIVEGKYPLESFAEPTQEGYVVRQAGAFKFNDFQQHIAKFVRKNHVQTSELWMLQPVIKNKLSSEK